MPRWSGTIGGKYRTKFQNVHFRVKYARAKQAGTIAESMPSYSCVATNARRVHFESSHLASSSIFIVRIRSRQS